MVCRQKLIRIKHDHPGEDRSCGNEKLRSEGNEESDYIENRYRELVGKRRDIHDSKPKQSRE